EALDAFCNTFHIPEEVHPVLPNQDDTMHERPAGKLGCTLDFLTLPNLDDFACPASFPWHTAKHVIRDPASVATDINAQDYATVVAHPFSFRKFPEAFLCFVGLSRHYTLDEDTYPRFVHKNGERGCLILCLCYAFYGFVVLLLTIILFRTYMDLFTFIHAPDPTKVRVVEREREVDEPRLLDTTVGHTVPLLSVAPDRADSELKASVERLFDKDGSGAQTEQGDSARGGPDADIHNYVSAGSSRPFTSGQGGAQGKQRVITYYNCKCEETDTSSLVNHNAYLASSSAPQIAYAQMDQQSSEYSPPEAGLVVPVFQKGDDPIDAINHMMLFLTSVVASRYPTTNNQLRTSSNPHQQATINNGRVTIQPIQGRQNFVSAGSSRPYTSEEGGAQGKQRVITCYNCKGECHMFKQCTKPRRKRDAEWFKDKVLLRLLVRAVLNAEVGVMAIPTLPFVAAYVSTTSDRDDEDHTNSVAEPNLRTIRDPQRSSTPVMTTATTVTSMVDSTLVAKERTIKPSLFAADSSSAGGVDPNTGVFLDLSNNDLFVGGIRTVIDPDTDIQKVYDELLKAKDGEIEILKAQLLLREAKAAEAIRLRAQTSNLEVVEKSLWDEERDALDVKVTDLEVSVVGKERDLTDLNAQLNSVKSQNDSLLDQAQLLLREAKAAEAIRLRAQTSNLEVVEKSLWDEVTDLEVLVVGKERDLTDLNAQLNSVKSQNDSLLDQKITVYDNCMEQLEKFQDDRMKVVNDKLAKLDSDLVEMACHLEEKFYPHLLNTISGRRWLLTYGLKLFLVKCLNSSEYLTPLGAAISHIAAYNPDAKVDFNTALQELREVDFPLLVELKSYKDASTKDIMNVLRLKGALADAHGINDLQHDIEQLKVPIHISEDQVVLGETSLSFALSVSHSLVERIKKNIAAQRSALVGVWTPLSEPLSVTSLMGTKGTFNVMPTTADTTTTLSTTLAFASTISLIFVDDYEVMSTDDQEGANGNAKPFLNVNDA
nr:hypothetical protein [Tanacetum cinerariifolium]